MEIFNVPLTEIYADPDFNCRGRIAPMDVVELARSIDIIGLQQPISLQPYDGAKHEQSDKKWRIILGHRRFEAFKLLAAEKDNKEQNKYQSIPCTIQHNLKELDARVLNLNENLERQNLNIIQEAKALVPFIKARWTQQEIATRLNQSVGWVHIRAMALKLEPEIQEEIASGLLTQQQIKDLFTIPAGEERYAMVREIKDAKIRGEKTGDIIRLKQKRNEIKQNITKKAFRLRSDIVKMQIHIQQTVGNNFGTRALAWASGEISDLELYEDIKELADELGKEYEIPTEGLAGLNIIG